MSPLIKQFVVGLAGLCTVFMAAAADPVTQPLDPARLERLRSVGLVDAAEPTESDIHVYSRAYGSGSFAADIEQLGWIREFSPLTGVARAGLQASFSEALARALARERGTLPALELRRLASPGPVRGIHRLAQAALPKAGTDAVLATFLRVGYVAFKPDTAFKPFVTLRAVLFDTASGDLLYDEMLTAGQNPKSGDSLQVPVAWADGGATTLAALRADPAQAVTAWRAALEPLAIRLARDFVPLPPSSASATPAPPTAAPGAPALVVGAKPLKLQLTAGAPLLVKLPPATAPYVLRVAGQLAFTAERWSLLTPTVTVLDDKLLPLRTLGASRAAVRGGRIEQALYAGAGDAWLWIAPAPQPPVPEWHYISATTQKIYAGIIDYENHRFVDLTGPLPASTDGPLELRADVPVTSAR